jgi:hypothetical protein
MGAQEEPREGDDFVTCDQIRAGDLVYWDRLPDGRFALRRLEESLLGFFGGTVYRIRRGAGPTTFLFTRAK